MEHRQLAYDGRSSVKTDKSSVSDSVQPFKTVKAGNEKMKASLMMHEGAQEEVSLSVKNTSLGTELYVSEQCMGTLNRRHAMDGKTSGHLLMATCEICIHGISELTIFLCVNKPTSELCWLNIAKFDTSADQLYASTREKLRQTKIWIEILLPSRASSVNVKFILFAKEDEINNLRLNRELHDFFSIRWLKRESLVREINFLERQVLVPTITF